jgi:hypothetical protein
MTNPIGDFVDASAKSVGLILTIKCQKSPRNRDS